MNLARRLAPILSQSFNDIFGKITSYGNVTYSVSGHELTITPTDNQTMVRLDNSPNIANFTAEFDMQQNMTGAMNTVFVYRTTKWNTQGYAYAIGVSSSSYLFGKQDNSGSSTAPWYDLGSKPHGITYNDYIHFKLIVSGNNHKIYANDVLIFDVNNSEFLGSGQFGINCYVAGANRHIKNLVINPL